MKKVIVLNSYQPALVEMYVEQGHMVTILGNGIDHVPKEVLDLLEQIEGIINKAKQ